MKFLVIGCIAINANSTMYKVTLKNWYGKVFTTITDFKCEPKKKIKI